MEKSQLIFADEGAIIKKQADVASYEGLEEIFKEIDELKGRLKSNVNFDISMELLFIKIRSVLAE